MGIVQVRLDLGQVPNGSQSSPSGSEWVPFKSSQIPMGSWVSSSQVSSKFRASLGVVLIKPRQGPGRGLAGLVNLRMRYSKSENETVNHFPKIKKEFSVEKENIFVDHYFTSQYTL